MQGIYESVQVFGRSASMHHGLCVCEWTKGESGRKGVGQVNDALVRCRARGTRLRPVSLGFVPSPPGQSRHPLGIIRDVPCNVKNTGGHRDACQIKRRKVLLREVPTFPRVRRSSFSKKLKTRQRCHCEGPFRGNTWEGIFLKCTLHLLPAHASGCPPMCLMACCHWPEAASASPCLIRSAMVDIPSSTIKFLAAGCTSGDFLHQRRGMLHLWVFKLSNFGRFGCQHR